MPLTRIQAEYRRAFMGKLHDGRYRFEQVPACPCGSAAVIALADRDRFGIPVGIVLCRACGLARTSPRLAADNLAEFYEHDYHGLHQGIRRPDPSTALFRRGQGAAIHEFLADLLPDRPLRVADVGCGTGGVLREFESAAGHRHITSVGCEYSGPFAAAGRRAGSDIRHGGLEQLTNEPAFDVVILSHVVEHLPDLAGDLAAVRGLGHAKTLFYVEVPGLLTIDRKPEYAYRLDQYLTLAHTFHFTLSTLTASMARAGFEVVRGNEVIRTVFRQAAVVRPASDTAVALDILDSLRRLDSWAMRVRRLRPQLRQFVTAAAHTLLSETLVARIRGARYRSTAGR